MRHLFLIYPIIFLLSACMPHFHSNDLNKYEHPNGEWVSRSGYKIIVDNDKYQICLPAKCETGEVYKYKRQVYLVDFEALQLGEQLMRESHWIRHNPVPDGANAELIKRSKSFDINSGQPFADKYCYGRPCIHFGPERGRRYAFHWHGPVK